jgi:hypothetical protein
MDIPRKKQFIRPTQVTKRLESINNDKSANWKYLEKRKPLLELNALKYWPLAAEGALKQSFILNLY